MHEMDVQLGFPKRARNVYTHGRFRSCGGGGASQGPGRGQGHWPWLGWDATVESLFLQHMESSTSVKMDERLWSKFPEDILDRVIAHLPLSKICQLRSLCKRWKEPYLFSADFLEILNKRSVRGTYCPLFVTFHNMLPDAAPARKEGCIAYDFARREWKKLPPLSCFPSNVKPCGQVTGAGGLLLLSFKRHFLDIISYSVCNPVTGQWTELPPLPDGASALPPLLLRMIMDRNSKAYKVVLVEPVRNTYVFDSTLGYWRFLAPMPLRPYGANVVCNGALYCIGLGKMGERMAVMKCDLEKRTWTSLSLPISSLKFYYVTNLLEWQGTVLVVIDISSRNRVSVYTVAELEKMVDWALIAEMPEEFVSLGWPRTSTCVADKHRLYFTKFEKGCFEMVVYDFVDDTWDHVRDKSMCDTDDEYHVVRVPLEPDWTLNCFPQAPPQP